MEIYRSLAAEGGIHGYFRKTNTEFICYSHWKPIQGICMGKKTLKTFDRQQYGGTLSAAFEVLFDRKSFPDVDPYGVGRWYSLLISG